MSDSQRGRFVWYDLTTTDVDAAIDFYTKVTGWSAAPQQGEMAGYTMWLRDDAPIGGVLVRSPEMGNVPPNWVAYIYTTDIGATVADVERLGGAIHQPVTPIPGYGQFAIAADPQGAAFAIYQGDNSQATEWNPQPGDISWLELATTDWQAAFDFYDELFGWEKQQAMEMGEAGTYQMFGQDGRMYGGLYNLMPEQAGMPPNWLIYVRVTDLDSAIDRVRSLGGRVLNGPMDVPGGSRIAQCMDPQGAAFALHQAAG